MNQLDTMLYVLTMKHSNWFDWSNDTYRKTTPENIDIRLDFVQNILIKHLDQKEKESYLDFIFKITNPSMTDVNLAQKLVKSLCRDTYLINYRETDNVYIKKSYMANIQAT